MPLSADLLWFVLVWKVELISVLPSILCISVIQKIPA